MKSEDIAKLAGVSRSTVTRVINNYPDIPQKTRDKVLKVIKQYQYEPNNSAQVLAGKATKTIGLFVVSVVEDDRSMNRIYQNNYFAPFVEAVIDSANAAGYYVLVHTVYSKLDYVKVKQAFLQKRIDGGIIVGTQKDRDFVREIVNFDKPCVLIDYDTDDLMQQELKLDHLAVVNSSDYDGAYEAMNYLISSGHRNIGFISGNLNTHSGRQRYHAYIDILKKHQITIHDDHIVHGNFHKQTAYAQIQNLIVKQNQQDLPTAFFSANDDMAIAAMEALKDHGFNIPDDISIIGFDDIHMAAQLEPKLSSVRLPIFDMSKEAVSKIVTMCNSNTSSFSSTSYPTQLIIRNSSQVRN